MIKLKNLIIEINKAQIKKLNKRLKEKDWPVNIDLINKNIKIFYNSTNPSEKEIYYYDLLHSIVANNKRFDDVYYSIN